MLQRRVTERLGCLAGGYRDIKAHPWMKEVNFNKLVKKQIRAPWVPYIEDTFDISNFEEYECDKCSDYKDFTRTKKPLTADEQVVFQDF
jgi:protein kinase A